VHRFFISPNNIKEKLVLIDDEQARHAEKVLRLKPGDFIQAFDGTGCEYILELKGRHNGILTARIQNIFTDNNEPLVRLYLAQGLAKGDKMNTIIQKAVEIGVSTIYPFTSEHTVVNLGPTKAEKKRDKWEVIAREACKQCRRSIIPEIKPIVTFENLLMEIGSKVAIMLYENEEQLGLKDVLKQNKERYAGNEVFVLVGPEGGFAHHEVEAARKKDIYVAGLGPRILRTETAGIAVSSIIMYEYGDLG